jgi:hypothetical protein
MKRLIWILLLAGAVVALGGDQDVTLSNGTVLHHARIAKFFAGEFVVEHDGGIAHVPWSNMPRSIQVRYQFDPRQANEVTEAKRQGTMEYVIPIVIVAAVIVWVSIAITKRKRRERLFAEARAFLDAVKQNHAFPVVSANVILKPEEVAFYSAPSVLYETQAVRHYQAGHAGFRVAKGVYIGGTSGRSVSTQEWSKIDTGNLTITSKRLIFNGTGQERTLPLGKIVSVESSRTGVHVSVDGRQKGMIFGAINPLIPSAIIQICCQSPDPRDLSQMNLDVNFAG